MGTALSRAAQWTSVSDNSKGKLEFSRTNGKILSQILEFVKSFPAKYPEEAAFVFRNELSWSTTTTSDLYSSDYQTSGSKVTSSANDSNGLPLMTLENGILKVRSLREASKIFSVVKKENELQELRICLEANRDPIEKMLGPGFATIDGEENTLVRMFKKIESEDSDEGKIQLRLALLIQKFDVMLLNSSLQDISKDVRLTPAAVDAEVSLLQSFAGEASSCPIKKIEYTSDIVFTNGCRALPGRQVHGDISYLIISTHDQGELSVTASTFGCYINEGLNEDGTVKHEKKSAVFKNLIAILTETSKAFAENISNKNFTIISDTNQSESDFINVDEQQTENHMESDAQSVEGKPTAQKTTKKVKTQKDKKTTMQPSMKWKNLEDTEKKKATVKVTAKKASRKGSKNLSPSAYRRMSMYRNSLIDEDDISDSSDESEEEDEGQERRQDAGSDLPSEYWQIQKLVKYLKGGNQTATIIALCAMHDFNLMQETCQLAIRDVGGLEVLINLLDTEESKCKIGSLKILKEISRNLQIRRAIADLGGLQTMVKILRDPNKDLKCLAAETIANVAKFRRARRTVRQHGGIKKLVGLLDYTPCPKTAVTDAEVAKCGAMALWSCSKSTKNKVAIRKAGGIPLLAKLLRSTNEEMLIPVVGTLQECASEASYRLAIRTEGMIQDLVKNLDSTSSELQMHCAAAIFKCAEDKETRDLVREYNGLHPLVGLLSQSENKELLAAATGALWKCAISIENVAIMQELKAIEQLVALLTDQPEEVLVNVVGALGECAQEPANRLVIRKAGGIPNLVQLLTGTNQALLVNVTRAVGACATEQDNMVIIDKLDGVRLLWSLLKNQNPQVQASAAWAVCPCIENAKDAGEMVRSFVGGLELIVSLLKSNDTEVLASVCAAIANIAKDEENLAVITDHGVVPMLAKLATTTNDKLRRHLAESIARCCTWGNNRVSFGKEGAVAPLVHYLHSNDESVHRATAQALYQLSRDPDNCITMHENGVVKLLLNMVGSSDCILQEAAAGCIGNIRRLALANEKARYA